MKLVILHTATGDTAAFVESTASLRNFTIIEPTDTTYLKDKPELRNQVQEIARGIMAMYGISLK